MRTAGSAKIEVDVKTCPNPSCPYTLKHDGSAEYGDTATTCSDCETDLVAAGLASERAPALPMGLGLSLDPTNRSVDVTKWALSFVLPLLLFGFAFVSFLPANNQSPFTTNNAFLGLFGLNFSTITSWFALQTGSFVAGLLLVHLVAQAVPRLRPKRHTERGQRTLLIIGLSIGALLTVGHAFLTAQSQINLAAQFNLAFDDLLQSTVIAAIALTVVSSLVVTTLFVVSQRFRVNGFSVFYVAFFVPRFANRLYEATLGLENGSISGSDLFVAAATLGAVALVAWRVLDDRPLWAGRPRSRNAGPHADELATWCNLPVVGVSAVVVGTFGTQIFASGYSIAQTWSDGLEADHTIYLYTHVLPWISIVLTIGAFVFVASRFWPKEKAARAARELGTTLAPGNDDAKVSGTALGLEVSNGVKDRLIKEALLTGLLLFLTRASLGEALGLGLYSYLTVVILVALIHDVTAEFRMEKAHGQLVRVGQLANVWEASVLKEAWTRHDSDVAIHVRGVHHRAFYQLFAPEIFLDVFTTADKASAVRDTLETLRFAALDDDGVNQVSPSSVQSSPSPVS